MWIRGIQNHILATDTNTSTIPAAFLFLIHNILELGSLNMEQILHIHGPVRATWIVQYISRTCTQYVMRRPPLSLDEEIMFLFPVVLHFCDSYILLSQISKSGDYTSP